MRAMFYISLMAMLLPAAVMAQAEFTPTACSDATECMAIEGVCPGNWNVLHKEDEASMRAYLLQLSMKSKCDHDYLYVAKPKVICIASRCVEKRASVNNESAK